MRRLHKIYLRIGFFNLPVFERIVVIVWVKLFLIYFVCKLGPGKKLDFFFIFQAWHINDIIYEIRMS